MAEYAGKMLGGRLVTKQSGPEGKPVDTLLLAKKMDLKREMCAPAVAPHATPPQSRVCRALAHLTSPHPRVAPGLRLNCAWFASQLRLSAASG